MGRLTVGALLGLGAVMGILAAACATAPPATSPSASNPAVNTSPRVSTPTPVAMFGTSPTGQVLGARGTPGATGTPGAVKTVTTQDMMSKLDQFSFQLQDWANGAPTAADLMAMVQQANSLMGQLSQLMPQMSIGDRDQGLWKMSQIMDQMARVVDTHARQVEMSGAPSGTTTPGPYGGMMGTPGTMMQATPGAMMQPTPTTGPMSTPQMMNSIDQMRNQMMRLAADKPSSEDIINELGQMQAMLMTIRQQVGQISDQDIGSLMNNMTLAMDDMVGVMTVYVRQETGANPALTPTPTPLP